MDEELKALGCVGETPNSITIRDYLERNKIEDIVQPWHLMVHPSSPEYQAYLAEQREANRVAHGFKRKKQGY